MLLAIDLGNTETHVGVWNGVSWCALWRRKTGADGFADWLESQIAGTSLDSNFTGAVVASVVPDLTEAVIQIVGGVTECVPRRLTPGPKLGLEIRYDPPGSLGADRLANALAAKRQFQVPVLVVDIGTATTFEAIDRAGAFVGGAIMPGPEMSAAALAKGTATLPQAALNVPPSPIGNSTLNALQSGVMLGHAAAIQGLATRIVAELGDNTTVIATGGLGGRFLPLCPILIAYVPTLTLDGLVIAFDLLA